jgi:hypothetical protein
MAGDTTDTPSFAKHEERPERKLVSSAFMRSTWEAIENTNT